MVMLLCAAGELQAHAAASKAIFFSSMVNHSTLIKRKKKQDKITSLTLLLIRYYFLKLKLSRFGLCYKSSALDRCPIGGNKIVSRGHGGRCCSHSAGLMLFL